MKKPKSKAPTKNQILEALRDLPCQDDPSATRFTDPVIEQNHILARMLDIVGETAAGIHIAQNRIVSLSTLTTSLTTQTRQNRELIDKVLDVLRRDELKKDIQATNSNILQTGRTLVRRLPGFWTIVGASMLGGTLVLSLLALTILAAIKYLTQ